MVSQAVEGYGCSCGFKTDDLTAFRKHILGKSKDKTQEHKSLGRINLMSGNQVAPPWDQRTPEEKKATRYGKKSRDGEKKETSRQTEVLMEATEIKLIPRVYSMNFTPTMQAARVAATREWKWPGNMSMENFFDTVIYNFFKDHGLVLVAYVRTDDDGGGHGHVPLEPPPAEPVKEGEEGDETHGS